jgi:hypothetical protein
MDSREAEEERADGVSGSGDHEARSGEDSRRNPTWGPMALVRVSWVPEGVEVAVRMGAASGMRGREPMAYSARAERPSPSGSSGWGLAASHWEKEGVEEEPGVAMVAACQLRPLLCHGSEAAAGEGVVRTRLGPEPSGSDGHGRASS